MNHTACSFCQYRAALSQCVCRTICAVEWCASGLECYDTLPGTIHDTHPVPRFV